MFGKKKQSKMKEYIRGAGGTIVSKSVLNGASRLKWLFREDSEYGNGWVAFGDTDTQEYVDNAENMAIVDFNTLANIEPAVMNVFYMPVGSDLEFRSDKTGKYFVDTRTGKEIREPVENPMQIAFGKNLKFLNQEMYQNQKSLLFSVWMRGSPVLRMRKHRRITGYFGKSGRKNIPERTDIRIILQPCSGKAMKCIRSIFDWFECREQKRIPGYPKTLSETFRSMGTG